MQINLSKGISCTIAHDYEKCHIGIWQYYPVMYHLSCFTDEDFVVFKKNLWIEFQLVIGKHVLLFSVGADEV